MVQRDAIQALGEEFVGEEFVGEEFVGEEFDGEAEEQNDVEVPEYLTEDVRLQLTESLRTDSEIEGLFLSDHVSMRLKLLQDPLHSRNYTKAERRLLYEFVWSKKALAEINLGSAQEDDIPIPGPSTDLVPYKPPRGVVIGNAEEELNRIRAAHHRCERCFFNVCRYYIGKITRVIFVTAATSTIRLLKDFQPTTIVVDEASQMTETNTVTIAAQFFSSLQKIVLVGDLKQNSPFVGSTDKNEFGTTTEISLMERMTRTGVPSCLLRTQYRMHPHISLNISKFFYEDQLINGPNVLNRPGDQVFKRLLAAHTSSCTRHSVFVNVKNSILYTLKRGTSKVNPEYVGAAQSLLRSLINVGAAENTIGLLSFYKAQLQIHEDLNSKAINTMTVDAAQGRRFDYVILDTVTPGGPHFNLGFLTNLKKINVALSRARYGLIIVGSRTMGDVPYPNNGAKIWKGIIAEHQAHGALVDMAVDSRGIKQRYSIPGEQYASAYRDGSH